jgi:hypothetical protein
MLLNARVSTLSIYKASGEQATESHRRDSLRDSMNCGLSIIRLRAGVQKTCEQAVRVCVCVCVCVCVIEVQETNLFFSRMEMNNNRKKC